MTTTKHTDGPPFLAREITSEDWPVILQLFGPGGACGGCWCMYWRIPRGGKMWAQACGEPNKRALKKLVTAGKALGIVAFDRDLPVGWCSFGPRTDFPRTEAAKAYRRDDIDKVWSVNCFFVVRGYRKQGVADLMLREAVAAVKRRKGKVIEGYPVPTPKSGKPYPAAFAWTGMEQMFRKAGFAVVQKLSEARPLYRLSLESAEVSTPNAKLSKSRSTGRD